MESVEGVIALLTPYAFFLSIVVIVCFYSYFRFRSGAEVHRTVRAAIEQGQPLSPEFLERLTDSSGKPVADLRRGVIAVALGLGIGVFGLLVGEEHARGPLLAIGSLPFLIGVAYIGLWKFAPRQ